VALRPPRAAEARQDLARWLAKWQGKYPRLCDWVEANIEETLTYYRLPQQHHKHLKSANMLERLNQELKRRTRVVRIFPNAESCLRLVRALAVETHENWLEAIRYLNMAHLAEHKKEALRKLEQQAARRRRRARAPASRSVQLLLQIGRGRWVGGRVCGA
jgi:putative transposase